MPSRHFTSLKKQAAFIEKNYIDFPFDPYGNYSRRDLMNAGAYILLVHAELETYIEERIQELIRLADSKWRSSGKVSRTLLASCIYSSGRTDLPSEWSSRDRFSSIVIQAIKEASGRVAGNNGIREHNLIRLLYVVGYDVHAVDPVLIAELDAIGSLRGDHAHISSRHHFKQKFDPFDITKKIARAIGLLQVFDNELSAFRRSHFGH
ncbi:MAG: hypothetical protein JOZ72_03040 [Alphaproteobacteria bacterium]|nr:hypothetical protein [Alphaproteobacteria bacterium]